jgi:hypothetical protein
VDLDEAQRIFARWLDAGTRVAFVVLAAGFAAYAGGLLPPLLPFADLPRLWGLPLAQFIAASGAPTGWDWLAVAHRGDYFNYAGIALLASIVVAAYLRMLPLLARRARVFAVLAALEIVVLLVAASGLLNSFAGGTHG